MNNGRWTQAEETFIRENAAKLTFKQMSEHLTGRSARAVQLYMLRNHIAQGTPVIKRNLVQEILKKRIGRPELFAPDRQFYDEVGITQRRWGDLYFGRSPVTDKEYLALIEFFGVTFQEAFEARQLSLDFQFEDEKPEAEEQEPKKRPRKRKK